MTLDATLADALVAQVNAELAASHSYLAMAFYFDAQDLPGFAAFFRAQSAEESQHAARLSDFVVKREADVTLSAIPAPSTVFQSPSAAIRAALTMEQGVTQSIHALYGLAKEKNDYAAQTQLMWFIDEQVEEEDSFRNLLIQTEAAESDRWNLITLDKEIATQAATPPAA
jgi:ferritin